MNSTLLSRKFPLALQRRILCRASTTSGIRNDKKVLVIPGYLLDAQDFLPLVQTLRDQGYNAVLPPIRWFNWLPTLGGRSLRPILDRINFAALSLAQGDEISSTTNYEVPLPEPFTFIDWLLEFLQPCMGARLDTNYSAVSFNDKIAIVGSSASGWITRILLGSGPEYHNRVYNGAQFVHTLITLGSPHICDDGLTKKNLDFVNSNYPNAHEASVKYICVAGKAVKGKSYLGGLIKDFAYQSYELCCSSGDVWGDGVTPVDSALGLQGATHVILEDVYHSPYNGHQWYGSHEVVDKWSLFLDKFS
eukprot:g2620.t1